MDISSYYWSQNCTVLYLKLIRKFPRKKQKIDYLIESGIIKRDGDFIRIHFLDEQLLDIDKKRKILSDAGKKGVEVREKNKQATLKAPLSNKDKEKDKDKDNTIAPLKKSPRKPDPIWDCLCDIFGLNPVTKSEQSRIGKIVRDLKLKSATIETMKTTVSNYKREWPGVTITPNALLRHWDQFKPKIRTRNKPTILPEVKPEDKISDTDMDEFKQKRLKMGL